MAEPRALEEYDDTEFRWVTVVFVTNNAVNLPVGNDAWMQAEAAFAAGTPVVGLMADDGIRTVLFRDRIVIVQQMTDRQFESAKREKEAKKAGQQITNIR